MSFHENLKRLRIINNMSQEKFAETLGVSRQSVAKYECGRCYPEVDKLILISDLFNISLDRLLKVKKNSCSYINQVIDGRNIMDKETIEFLCRAKKSSYAGGKPEEEVSSRPNSHDIEYVEGDLKYIDSYLGSQKFSGEEALWKSNIPIWSMNYYGRVLNSKFDGEVLHEALKNVTEEMPYRGPKIFKKDEFKYECSVKGNYMCFYGKEVIYKKDIKVFECIFHGGIIV